MPDIAADPPVLPCYFLFSKTGIEEYQEVEPVLFWLPGAFCRAALPPPFKTAGPNNARPSKRAAPQERGATAAQATCYFLAGFFFVGPGAARTGLPLPVPALPTCFFDMAIALPLVG
jgi:hypothetical protein